MLSLKEGLSFFPDEGDDPSLVIGTWYNAQPLALCPFDRIVLLVDQQKVDFKRYDPYHHTLFLVYSVRAVIGRLYIHGVCSWSSMWRNNGTLTLTTNLADVHVPDAVEIKRPVFASCDEETSLETLTAYIDWLSDNGPYVEPSMVLSLTAAIIVSLVPDEGDRAYWHKQLLIKEASHKTRDHLVSYFVRNVTLSEPTVLDLQHFYLRDPGAAPPTYVFHVPAEDGPIFRPIFPGGIRHLTYLDLDAWAWTKYKTTSRRFYRPLACGSADERDLKLVERLKRRRQQQATTFDAVAIDNLYPLVPPCIGSIMAARQFPPFEHAKTIVKAFLHSGVAKESVVAWFETMNARWPKTPPVSLMQRFNIDYWWNPSELGKVWCKHMVTTLQCPFYDIEDYKETCAPGKKFSGPHSLIKGRALNRRPPPEEKGEHYQK